ncbi:DUF4190 domain-containing protein [Streptomyces sp. A7024]|uniref:DUF4190 domain-containing protein n=1 Tax=Streptomyces coryli TaxID=1128680 RepID=A0A6G4TXK5_9ACTN|nr:DUF4190 domain-containing protein [Streptomyces coryli]NGN64614.1 DUF4190 domain-containing protein [Streptomyces coryli]
MSHSVRTATSGVRLRQERSGLAVAALVTGILSVLLLWLWFVGLPLAIAAIVLGVMAIRRTRQRGVRGRAMAIVGVVLGGAAVLLAAILLIVGVSILNSDDGKDFQSCMDKANSQSQQDECAREFGRDLER